MIVVDARQRVKRLDAVGDQRGDDRLRGGGFVHSQRLGFRFAADVQIGLALSRGGVFPFRRGSANTPAQFLACHAPRKRGIQYHGGLLFIDLRDHYGLTQIVAAPDSPAFKTAEKLRAEWVVRVDGRVRARPAGTDNPDLPTGAVEVFATDIEVLGPAGELPMPVFGDQEYPEEIRLKYRFLDLRRERLHRNIIKSTAIIDS